MNITSRTAEKDKQMGNNWCKEVAPTLRTVTFANMWQRPCAAKICEDFRDFKDRI